MSARIACLKADPNVRALVGEDPIPEPETLGTEEDAIADQDGFGAEADKQEQERFKAAEAAVAKYRSMPTSTNYEEAKAAAQGYDELLMNLETAKANIENATAGLTDFLKDKTAEEDMAEGTEDQTDNGRDGFELESEKQFKEAQAALKAWRAKPYSKELYNRAAELAKPYPDLVKALAEAKKVDEAKKGELAKTGVALGALAGIATLSTIGGVVAVRRRNH
ncbi:LPXTG cell wall anchor domain-containing protein [Arcanobacterium pinnipediorum]|uniref:LPXTG cell wall anchor domain-containing protein n=1 Tax=Arcanobacterium pinnipediorum TaxID=1503041 RepID=A0ABY5AKE6_9ACTO|nr:LPXTG cell wall anchor domain-containing protein [Arcanobacterium pinnipediorum]USR79906.1 LPXTG cell wall anchor domain-containing protein [Arcanobacterium pinnipediorum]